MKKFALAIAIVATLVVALVSAGTVAAKGSGPYAPETPGTGTGYGRGGMMAGRGAGQAAGIAAGEEGILHDAIIEVYAQELGISVDDLNTRLAAGETLSQIAAAQGLTSEQFFAMMQDARAAALDQAVAAGTLTQEQADWLKTRGAGMSGQGARGGRGTSGGYGLGTGDPATCPYYTPSN